MIIESIAYHLPEKRVTNKDLKIKNPHWDVEKIEAKAGVLNRHIAQSDETAFDLSKIAVEKLLRCSSLHKDDIHGIIYCTQSPDYIMPSNAFLIHKEFDFGTHVWAFDINLACSGFVYGLAIARGMIDSGTAKNVLLVTADTYSKYINEKDRSTSLLFGDAGAATMLKTSNKANGILDLTLATEGKAFESFYIPAGGCRLPKQDSTSLIETDYSGNEKSKENIHMNGFAVWKFISNTVPIQIRELLDRNNISIDQIDQFIFHQASKMTIDSLTKALNINESMVFTNLHRIGNTVSASIPIALKDAIDEGKVKKGDLILLSGFGVGLSWGSALIRL